MHEKRRAVRCTDPRKLDLKIQLFGGLLMAKYNYEFKRKLVDEYIKGKTSYRQLEEKYGVNKPQIIKWVNNFKEFGDEGLKRSRNNREYSVEFKLEAITRYETTELSYQQLALELGMTNYSLIANWRRKYKENGIDGLRSKKVGRPMKGKINKTQDSAHLKQNTMSLETREQLENRIKELEAENRKLTIQKKFWEQLRSLEREEAMNKRQGSHPNSDKNTR